MGFFGTLRSRIKRDARALPLVRDIVMWLKPRRHIFEEVADTTLRLDGRIKIPLYARAGVREVWLVDLTTARLEVHREPLGDRYGDVRVLARGERIAPEAFPYLSLDVAELIG